MGTRGIRTGYTEDVAELPSSRAGAGSAARAGLSGPAGPGGPDESARPAGAASRTGPVRPAGPAGSLRAEQVAQTRSALIGAGRRLFGEQGFAATSVDDLARAARVTTGALYHHFPTKTALFETVFETVHAELMTASTNAASGAADELDALARGFDAFLDAVLEPDVQRIIVTDAPAVLGLARFTEVDERYAVSAIVAALQAAGDAGRLHADDPETIARLLLGALVRGSMLIAGSADQAATRESVGRAVRVLLAGFAPRPGEGFPLRPGE
jgi:AcrR family transcriptional regulator